MRAPDELLAKAEDAAKTATRQGADAAEVYLTQAHSLRIAADAGSVLPSLDVSDGATVRVHVAGRAGVCSTSAIAQLPAAIEQAIRAARGAAAARAIPYTSPRRAVASAQAWSWPSDSVDRMTDVVARVLSTGLAAKDVTYVEARWQASCRDIALATSDGLAVTDRVQGGRMDVELRAERGTAKRGSMDSWMGPDILRDPRPEAWADALATRARDALDASPLDARPDLVLFAPAPAGQLLGTAAQAFSAAVAAAGQSPLKSTPGEQVYSDVVSLTDEPQGPRGGRFRAIDDEGEPTARLPLVESGVLRSLLFDRATAHAAGRASTGHGFRKGASGGPAPRPANLVLEPGDRSFDDLLADAGRAVVVTEPLLGSFTSNAVTGDFSVVAPFAFLAEGGRIARALPPTTLGGNAHDVLRRVRGLGKDLRACRAAAAPHVLTGGVSCAT